MESKEQAEKFFLRGYLCSQSILMAYAPRFNLKRDTASRLAASFGGGLARRGETCGAVIAACMVLGLNFGPTTADDLDSKERTYQSAHEFISQFQARNGSIECSQLLDIDISDPANLEKAREQQLFTTRCPVFVSTAAEILNLLLADR
jgi:C_GCAxxG_C_C family probable redox protein